MSDALDAAIRAAMEEQGCESYANCADGASLCNPHDGDDCDVWDDERDVCKVVARAVTVGFEAGRRDALTEIAPLVRELRGLPSRYTIAHPENTLRVLNLVHEDVWRIADRLRALLSTTEEAKP